MITTHQRKIETKTTATNLDIFSKNSVIFIYMRLSVIISGLIFISSSSPVTSQQLIFKTYTEEDGLVSNPVRRVFQDSRGFIWIGTWQGLSKYDGHKFTNYTTVNGLSGNMINDLYESPDGKLYVAENNGTVDILQHDEIIKKAAFRNVVINQFYITHDHRVIAATDTGGIHEIKNGNLVKPLQSFPSSSFNDLTEMNDSLFITGDEGPLTVLNKQFEIISEVKQHKEITVFKIFKDSKNRIWVGTVFGLKLVSPVVKNNRQINFALVTPLFNIPVLKNHQVSDMLEDSIGNFWIATTNGLVKIGLDGAWQVFTEKDGLPSSNIYCLFQDKEKNIWIGTSLGLSKLVTKNNTRIYTVEQGLNSNNVGFLMPVKKDLFLIFTEQGTQLFNPVTKHFSSISSNNISYFGVVKNSRPVLLYSNNYIGKYDPVKAAIVIYTVPDTSITNVHYSIMDANGIIFSSTQKGLLIQSGVKYYFEKKIPHRITFLLIDKKGYLWVGTWNNGLYRIEYNSSKVTGEFMKDKTALTVQDFSYLLPDKSIRCLFEDSKGNIWIGTRNAGTVQLDNNRTQPYTIQHFELRQGLMSNWARVIAEDTKGCIWIGSELGIDKLIPAANTFRVFNFSRVNNYFDNINAIVPTDDNSLWLATSKGLINIIDGEMEKTPAGTIYITSVKLGDTSFNYNKHVSGKKAVLKYFQNQAAFEFSSPAFVNEKQILYSFRLVGGVDTTWSKPANLQNVSFASLQPGNYRFEVRTTGWNGEWGLPENFSFMVRKPYWQTGWFYSLAGLIVILFFYALYRYRIKQLLKVQTVRNRIASDLHDDIGATLTNINMLSAISRKNLEQPLEAEKFLQRISEEVTSTSQALNDIIWSVNSRNDSIEEILARMRRYAAELFDNSNTLCHLSLNEAATDKKISMEQRKDLYLIYKESMNNILKHAGANNVWIHVEWQNGNLCLKIKDDGKGFNPAIKVNGNGLKNIHARTGKWKGNTAIKTAPGSGTFIEISIPLVK
jgi:ligand-binding sensor domain-containing protein/two-component sensor histidine kinase